MTASPTAPQSSRVSIVLLHGHDSRPGAWVDFMDDLLGQLEVLLPGTAPLIDIRALSGPVVLGAEPALARFAWFDENVAAFPDAEHAARWVASRLSGPCVLIGFSQGAAVALTVGSHDDADVIGVVSLSGFLPDGVDAVPACPLLVMHGEDDELVGVFHGERTARAAKAAGVPVEVVLAEYGHTLPHDIGPIVSWLAPLLERSAHPNDSAT